jgi:hypothetical protein
MNNIINIISKSEGIVIIYSQFVWSGIAPLAVALEHIGFSRYGARNLLQRSNVVKNVNYPNIPFPSYCIFSGDKLYKTIEKMKLDNQNNIFDIINKNKNYMKKGVIFFHQAWTDFINSISLVKHYNKSYDKLILIISSNLKKNVDFFIKNTNNIDVIYVEQEILDKENNGSLYLLDYLKETLEIELDDYDLLIHGFPDHYRKDEYKSN